MVSEAAIGEVVDGRYRLTRLLGKGGFGAVYAAEPLASPGSELAVKLLSRPREGLDDFEARFRREVRNAQRLCHPNAVRIFAFGTWGPDILYYVMELCEGRSLRELCKAEGPLAPARAVRLTIQVLEVLGAAHALGMVHRDIKPDNVQVMVRPGAGEVVKLLDFGLAKVLSGTESQDLTAADEITGTFEYMAPEQFRGARANRRSDLYAVGAVLYEVLAGQRGCERTTSRRGRSSSPRPSA
ncbi:serine/threonine-protein kinase [Planctomycetota bacterium]